LGTSQYLAWPGCTLTRSHRYQNEAIRTEPHGSQRLCGAGSAVPGVASAVQDGARWCQVGRYRGGQGGVRGGILHGEYLGCLGGYIGLIEAK